jgi:hypothetical protein
MLCIALPFLRALFLQIYDSDGVGNWVLTFCWGFVLLFKLLILADGFYFWIGTYFYDFMRKGLNGMFELPNVGGSE